MILGTAGAGSFDKEVWPVYSQVGAQFVFCITGLGEGPAHHAPLCSLNDALSWRRGESENRQGHVSVVPMPSTGSNGDTVLLEPLLLEQTFR